MDKLKIIDGLQVNRLITGAGPSGRGAPFPLSMNNISFLLRRRQPHDAAPDARNQLECNGILVAAWVRKMDAAAAAAAAAD